MRFADELREQNMLSEFYIAVEDFQAELKDCGQGLAEYVGINHIQRHRMSDLGQDMISFCECFARAHINATMWVSDDVHEMNRRLSPNPPDWQDIHKFLSGNHNHCCMYAHTLSQRYYDYNH